MVKFREALKEALKEVDEKINTQIGKSGLKFLDSPLKSKIKHKHVLRKSQTTVKIPEYKTPSVLGDTNRFFKEEMEEGLDTLFFK